MRLTRGGPAAAQPLVAGGAPQRALHRGVGVLLTARSGLALAAPALGLARTEALSCPQRCQVAAVLRGVVAARKGRAADLARLGIGGHLDPLAEVLLLEQPVGSTQ